uniref:Uncharacterized protein n=1 Tax=Anguilla anguilla TaxID=7936 RepID=A0A0E9UW78_ANGAN
MRPFDINVTCPRTTDDHPRSNEAQRLPID